MASTILKGVAKAAEAVKTTAEDMQANLEVATPAKEHGPEWTWSPPAQPVAKYPEPERQKSPDKSDPEPSPPAAHEPEPQAAAADLQPEAPAPPEPPAAEPEAAAAAPPAGPEAPGPEAPAAPQSSMETIRSLASEAMDAMHSQLSEAEKLLGSVGDTPPAQTSSAEDQTKEQAEKAWFT